MLSRADEYPKLFFFPNDICPSPWKHKLFIRMSLSTSHQAPEKTVPGKKGFCRDYFYKGILPTFPPPADSPQKVVPGKRHFPVTTFLPSSEGFLYESI